MSALTAVRRDLVARWDAALPDGVACWSSWPGPAAERQMAFFVEARAEYEDAALKAGRRNRNELLTLTFEAWSFGAYGPTDADEPQSLAEAYVDALGSLLADDVTLSQSVQWALLQSVEFEHVPFETGWAAVGRPVVVVQARLT